MIKVGLLGAENSHAKHFAEAINGKKLYEGFKVTHIFGNDEPKMTATLCREYDLVNSSSSSDVIENCDVIVITYRKGSLHHEYAMQALRAGKAAFIDKPFTCDLAQAEEIVNYARENKLLICGGSNLKGLSSLAPVKKKIVSGTTTVISFAAEVDSEYDGYWFYGSHSAELCLELFGTDYRSIKVSLNGASLVATVLYEDRQCIIINSPKMRNLGITVYNGDSAELFHLPLDYHNVGSNDLCTMIKTGKMPRDYDFYTASVRLTGDIIAAIKSGA